MKKIIIVGDGGHAKVVIDIIQEMNCYEIIGITSNNNINRFCGYPVLGNDDILSDYLKKGINNIALGIGGFKDNIHRTELYNKFSGLGFNIINAIHPNTVISKSVDIGNGVVVFPGVVLNAEVKIGNNVIIATGSTIDHETIIESNTLVSAGVTIGANALIGEGSLCALGSKIVSGVTIGKNCLVAAGAVVVNDIDDNSVVCGIPAKKRII